MRRSESESGPGPGCVREESPVLTVSNLVKTVHIKKLASCLGLAIEGGSDTSNM